MVNVTLNPACSRYVEQVRRIAPPELVGRTSELAELAEFCADPSSRYVWWRAPAWTGKSALMSWFVLRPPAGVQVVSFFVTARYAAQSDRRAFCANVLEQLCTLPGEPMPTFTDATLDAQILGKLTDAATTCQTVGERLVLLVDGLDEDSGTDGHSVAALLPVDLPAGMAVIVAGRPDPPVPADVPADHPLRDPAIVRSLSQSPVAQAEQLTMKRDLNTLIGSEVDILGLLVASGGGLTRTDLAELTDREPWDIEEALRTAAGRSFARRNAYWRAADETYLLAHEELLISARTMLGRRLDSYRDRLHAWADSYRDAGWPAETPEYLLLGYTRMLDDDLERRVRLATDKARHDRMYALTHSHVAAAAEITELQNILVNDVEPDLVAMMRLAVHHARFTAYFNNIPKNLPEAWAFLGHFDRAEQLIRAMSSNRTDALRRVARLTNRAGQKERAEALLRSFHMDCSILDEVDSGRRPEIHYYSSRLPLFAPRDQSSILAERAIHEAELGEKSKATAIAEEAENAALNGIEAVSLCFTLANLTAAAAEIGDFTSARSLAAETLLIALSDGDGFMPSAVRALARAQLLKEAAGVCRTMMERNAFPVEAVHVAEAKARLGEIAEARQLIESMESDGEARATAMCLLIKPLVAVQDFDSAAEIARMTEPHVQPWTGRIKLLEALTDAGHLTEARELGNETEEFIRSSGRFDLAEPLSCLAAATRHTDIDQTRRLAAEIEARTAPPKQLRGEMAPVRAAAAVGDLARAESLALSTDDDFGAWWFLAQKTDLAATGRPMARLIHMGRWSQALEVLAEHRPDVVRIAIEEFRSVYGLNRIRMDEPAVGKTMRPSG
jgi:hypothetical protein